MKKKRLRQFANLAQKMLEISCYISWLVPATPIAAITVVHLQDNHSGTLNTVPIPDLEAVIHIEITVIDTLQITPQTEAGEDSAHNVNPVVLIPHYSSRTEQLRSGNLNTTLIFHLNVHTVAETTTMAPTRPMQNGTIANTSSKRQGTTTHLPSTAALHNVQNKPRHLTSPPNNRHSTTTITQPG